MLMSLFIFIFSPARPPPLFLSLSTNKLEYEITFSSILSEGVRILVLLLDFCLQNTFWYVLILRAFKILLPSNAISLAKKKKNFKNICNSEMLKEFLGSRVKKENTYEKKENTESLKGHSVSI